MEPRLGVNIDHIATLRQVRGEIYPDPVEALPILKSCRVSQVTVHLRADRRHIQDHDVERIQTQNILPMNLEMAVSAEMLKIALRIHPKMVTLVPEKRSELTTEGGLNCVVYKNKAKVLSSAIRALQKNKIHVSLFVDPHVRQMQAAQDLGADAVEIHTGRYCHTIEQLCNDSTKPLTYAKALRHPSTQEALTDIATAAEYAKLQGLHVYAGHGLHLQNLKPIVDLKLIEEYNIGHAIIARAVFVGLKNAILEIQKMIGS